MNANDGQSSCMITALLSGCELLHHAERGCPSAGTQATAKSHQEALELVYVLLPLFAWS